MIISDSLLLLAESGGQPLHAPDGFFSMPVIAAGWIVAVALLAIALRKTDRLLNERMVPMMGVLAAFVFAAQMLNFPVAGGTSGHFVGGAFAAIVLGVWPAGLVMTAVVATQALLFQDGGLGALGLNITNMGFVSIFVGYGLYRVTARLGAQGVALTVRAFIAAWASVVASAVAVTLQLAASGTTPLEVGLPAMVGVHLLIGIGEGLITAAALSFVMATRRDLLNLSASAPA